MKGKATRKTNA